MDAAGTRALRQRIERQQQWRQAASVQNDLDEASDPDAGSLSGIGEGIRFYACGGFQKRLVGGVWQIEALDTQAAARADA